MSRETRKGVKAAVLYLSGVCVLLRMHSHLHVHTQMLSNVCHRFLLIDFSPSGGLLLANYEFIYSSYR